MKTLLLLMFLLSTTLSALAETGNVSSLLKKHLGDRIEVYSSKEIWYCPDNTCEIYHSQQEHPDFPVFVYMHLYHQSWYTYDSEDFRKVAVEEAEIRRILKHYCEKDSKDATCILNGLQSKLKISTCFGRFDEGGFWGCDEFRDKALTK
jgi:hypothetical protein